jgi:hypothetical protein
MFFLWPIMTDFLDQYWRPHACADVAAKWRTLCWWPAHADICHLPLGQTRCTVQPANHARCDFHRGQQELAACAAWSACCMQFAVHTIHAVQCTIQQLVARHRWQHPLRHVAGEAHRWCHEDDSIRRCLPANAAMPPPSSLCCRHCRALTWSMAAPPSSPDRCSPDHEVHSCLADRWPCRHLAAADVPAATVANGNGDLPAAADGGRRCTIAVAGHYLGLCMTYTTRGRRCC